MFGPPHVHVNPEGKKNTKCSPGSFGPDHRVELPDRKR